MCDISSCSSPLSSSLSRFMLYHCQIDAAHVSGHAHHHHHLFSRAFVVPPPPLWSGPFQLPEFQSMTFHAISLTDFCRRADEHVTTYIQLNIRSSCCTTKLRTWIPFYYDQTARVLLRSIILRFQHASSSITIPTCFISVSLDCKNDYSS